MSDKVIVLLAFIWLGAISAISMEAKVKFNAELVDLRIGLDVGRTVFAAFDIFQWGLMMLLLIAAFSSQSQKNIIFTAGIFVIFAYQSFILLPTLNHLASNYINYAIVEKSSVHLVYIGFELLKATALLTIGLLTMQPKESYS